MYYLNPNVIKESKRSRFKCNDNTEICIEFFIFVKICLRNIVCRNLLEPVPSSKGR